MLNSQVSGAILTRTRVGGETSSPQTSAAGLYSQSCSHVQHSWLNSYLLVLVTLNAHLYSYCLPFPEISCGNMHASVVFHFYVYSLPIYNITTAYLAGMRKTVISIYRRSGHFRCQNIYIFVVDVTTKKILQRNFRTTNFLLRSSQ